MRRVALLTLVLFPVVAGADEVFIRGGGHLTGDVVERGPDSITVDIGAGRIGLLLSSVERIVPGATPVALYRRRAASLDAHDVPGWLALARWAGDEDLATNAREAFVHVLDIEPENAAAHRALGHVQAGGGWTTREEGYRDRGYVPYAGGWVSPEERRFILEERRAAAEERRAGAEAAARIREAEARARVAEVEAARAEAEVHLADSGMDSWSFGGGGWTPWVAGFYPTFSTGFYPAYSTFRPSFRPRHHSFGARRSFPGSVRSMKTRVPMHRFSTASHIRRPAPTRAGHASRPPASGRAHRPR